MASWVCSSLRERRPALILMDIQMPGISGFEALAQPAR